MREQDADILAGIARQAGQAIMTVRDEGFTVTTKADQSPLTTADTRSCRCILDGLAAAFPLMPVLCEETKPATAGTRRQWESCFVVDPLDGTKEFARGSDDFCVCIGLVAAGRPVFGVIHAPVTDTTYWGGPGLGAWRRRGEGAAQPIRAVPPTVGQTLSVLASHSHPDPRLTDFLARFGVDYELATRGSALKFCALASGEGHLYPRLNPTWEWDTAAGHALLLGAGGALTGAAGRPLTYNKDELLNGPFLALSWTEADPYPAPPPLP